MNDLSSSLTKSAAPDNFLTTKWRKDDEVSGVFAALKREPAYTKGISENHKWICIYNSTAAVTAEARGI